MAAFYKKLIQIGLCKRCALRYLGVRDATAYEVLGEHIVKARYILYILYFNYIKKG